MSKFLIEHVNINIVNLVGSAVQSPKIHYFNSGKTLCKFSLLVKSNSDNDGALCESIDLELWNKTAEVAVKYVPKGRLIGITGSLKFSRWLDRKTGASRQQSVILVHQIHLLGVKTDERLDLTSTLQSNQTSDEALIQKLYPNGYDFDDGYDDEDDGVSYDNSYEDCDTSSDYGYLDDMSNSYEQLYSLGRIE